VLVKAILLVGLAAATVTAASAGQPRSPAQPTFVASYDVVIRGGITKSRHKDNQSSDPSNRLTTQSDDAYEGRGILSLKQEANGRLVASSNSFAYLSATWQLSGQNGSNGSFSCSPPVTTTNGSVLAVGQVTGGVMYLYLTLFRTHEHNDDYDCGAHFTGFATDSTYEADSLREVQAAQPGGIIVTSADHPSVGTISHATDDADDSTNVFHSLAKWTISITKRSGSKKDDGPPGPSTSPGPSPGTRKVCTINGTPRNDVLTGTSGDDIICAYAGSDRIDGRGGNEGTTARSTPPHATRSRGSSAQPSASSPE
jgi:hypothetical protein